MISKFSIAKALRDQASITATAQGLTLVSFGEQFTPGINESFLEEAVIFGNDDSLGLSDSSSDYQIGVYQIKVYTPKTGTKWQGLGLVDAIQTAFLKGLELTHNGQAIRIKNAYTGPMLLYDTHFIHTFSAEYSALG